MRLHPEGRGRQLHRLQMPVSQGKARTGASWKAEGQREGRRGARAAAGRRARPPGEGGPRQGPGFGGRAVRREGDGAGPVSEAEAQPQPSSGRAAGSSPPSRLQASNTTGQLSSKHWKCKRSWELARIPCCHSSTCVF